VKPPPEACGTCGTALAPSQEYCLHCGSRIVPARRLSAVGRVWERRLGRYPGDWILASLLLLLVAAGSAAAGIVTSRGGRTESGAGTIVATSPIVTAPPVAPAPAAAPPTPTTTTATPRPTPKPPGNALATWPARNGYTVVLASIPARGSGLAEAAARAKAALAAGVRPVGVLDSARFASLHPGYYVVFVGVYGSLQDAQTAATHISGKYPNAYARQIVR
jgi:hypothetical protein